MEYILFKLTHPMGGLMPPSATPYRDVTADDARAMLAKSRPESVTVLDVRQDWEYQEMHLPGAKLLPLGELQERLAEVPRDKPILVYCRSGKRSAAASSLIAASGHPEVTNMLGGITAWNGASAMGAPDTGLSYFTPSDTPDDILALAYAMERGLGHFYLDLAASFADPELQTLFTRLAGFEDKHKLMIFHLYKALHPSAILEDLDAKATRDALEGGRDASDLKAEAAKIVSPFDALDMAMGIEAQALDLYMRFAASTPNPDTAKTLADLANEERGHLKALATLMDRLGAK
jgi:rhodanese-related sulfurtransferase/rubrerythrin